MEGIIYKVQPYQEHARLLFVYSKVGKKTLLAQGAQKTNNIHRILAQYLTRIEFKDLPKSFYTLSDAKILDDFKEIKSDFNHTKSAALILEIIDQMTIDDDMHQVIYDEMISALKAKHIEISALSFALKMLRPLGYQIDFHVDGRAVKGFNTNLSRIIYQEEVHPVDLDIKETTLILKLSMLPYDDLETISTPQYVHLKSFILKYYQYHLQTTLKNLQ